MRRSLRCYDGATGCPCVSERDDPPRALAAIVHSDGTTSRMQSMQAKETDLAYSSNHNTTQLLSDSQYLSSFHLGFQLNPPLSPNTLVSLFMTMELMALHD